MTIRVFLENTDKFTVVDNNVSVIGATGGTQRVVMAAGVTGLLADANVERFDLSGNLADYRLIAIAGVGLQIQDAAGVVITTIPSINGTAGLTVAFANGSAVLTQTGGSAFALGGTAVSTTTAAAVAATLIATDVSTSAAATTVVNSVAQTYVLTNSIDLIPGTAGNDTIIAGAQAGIATLSSGDQINGGAGTDTLSVYGNTNATAFTTAAVSNVEVVNALFDATAGSLNVSGNAGVTSVNIGTSTVTAATTASGTASVTLTKAQAAGITGTILNDQTTSNAANNVAVTVAFSDVTGGADTATLNVSNAKLALNSANTAGTGNGVTLAGVETLNIAATGSNALGALAIAQTTKLVITGAGSLSATLSTTSGVTKTIDGSAATGALTLVNTAAAAAVESIKTGTGNDTYRTVFANLTKDDAIDMSTGTDSLRFSDAADLSSALKAAVLAKVTGVEQLGTINALLTVDGDFVTQTSYYTDGAAGAFTLTNTANNADINFGAGVILASSDAMKLGATTLNINLAGSAAAASNVTAGLTLTGSATLNVKSSGTDGIANNVLALTAADNQTVVVTGSQNLTLTTTAAAATTGFSIDGSSFTGKLTVTGTAATDIVKGGSGVDTISGGSGAAVADTLTGGAGADKFIIISGATSSSFDTITDFVTKSDSIAFNAVAVLAANVTKSTVVVADFAAALAAANLVLTNTGGSVFQVNVQQVGADSYAFFNDGTATGADQAVKLTGVALAGVEAADFVAI